MVLLLLLLLLRFVAKGGKNTRQLNLRDHQENNNNRNSNIPMVNGWSIWEWNWNPNLTATRSLRFSALFECVCGKRGFPAHKRLFIAFLHHPIQPVFTFQLENSNDWLCRMTKVQTKWNGLHKNQRKKRKRRMKTKQWMTNTHTNTQKNIEMATKTSVWIKAENTY